jgi:hypothetical protein
MAYGRSPWSDFLIGAGPAAALGVGLDYAQSKVNPTFVGAPASTTGWVVSSSATALGLLGALVSGVTGDSLYYELGEGVGQVGVAGLAQHATHAVRYAMAKKANKLPTPVAPTQVLRTGAVRADVVRPLPASGPTVPYRLKPAEEVA